MLPKSFPNIINLPSQTSSGDFFPFLSFKTNAAGSRRRRTALSVSCPCLVFVRIFWKILSGVRILSGFSVRCLSVRILSVYVLSAVRILSVWTSLAFGDLIGWNRGRNTARKHLSARNKTNLQIIDQISQK